jgi:hypothetical protein
MRLGQFISWLTFICGRIETPFSQKRTPPRPSGHAYGAQIARFGVVGTAADTTRLPTISAALCAVVIASRPRSATGDKL